MQGLGAAIISPAALSIVMTTFEEGAERNKALGIWGAIGGAGAAVGVLAGGVLTKYLGWEWIFFVNVPVGITAFLLAPRFVRESRSERETSPDIAGAVTVTSGLALFVYAVSKAPDHGWTSGWTFSRLAVAVVLLGIFLVIESRAKHPLMPFTSSASARSRARTSPDCCSERSSSRTSSSSPCTCRTSSAGRRSDRASHSSPRPGGRPLGGVAQAL